MSYETYEKLLREKGVNSAAVSRATGISQTVFSEWKKGKSNPKADKMQKIAEYFGVPTEYLITGESPTGYYYDEESMQIAQEIYQNEDLHMLFDLTKDASPDEIKDFTQVILLMQKRERHEE